ncbi:hypothetical protein K2X30_11850 [bacterium]|nr:hypothetical protein [bacterium]
MKKKNDTPRISTSIGVSLLVLVTMLTPWSQSSFASWDLSSLAKLSLIHIETVNRSNQAREILRENYHPDLIRGQEVEKVHAFIHEWVRTNLQGKWKVHTAEIASTIIQESAKRDLDPIFLVAVIDQESKFHRKIPPSR